MSKYIVLLLFISITLVACSSDSPGATAGNFATPLSNQVEIHEEGEHQDHAHVHVDAAQATGTLEVALVSSELVLGPNRFAVGLFDDQRQVVHEADVHFHYYDLTDPAAPVLEMEADATAVQTPDGLTTIFAHEREFQRAGEWGVEVQARFSDGSAALKRIGFQVLAESPTLKPGQAVPALQTPTLATVDGDLSKLTSALDANPDLYQLSLAQALTSGKPTLLLFATPAFCQTRFCGPVYEQTDQLEHRYGDTFNFIHVEVYTGLPDPSVNNWEIAPTMTDFGLTTEPWLYLIDAGGTVFYRVEGIFTTAEVERQMQALGEG
jgi:hypothetical protein